MECLLKGGRGVLKSLDFRNKTHSYINVIATTPNLHCPTNINIYKAGGSSQQCG